MITAMIGKWEFILHSRDDCRCDCSPWTKRPFLCAGQPEDNKQKRNSHFQRTLQPIRPISLSNRCNRAPQVKMTIQEADTLP
jgi:hypothetical protein